MEIIHQDLREAGESLGQELEKYERYLKDTVGLSAVSDPPHALEIMGRIERVKKLIRDEGIKLNEWERKSERKKRFEERVVRLDPDEDSDKGLDGSEASAFSVYLPGTDAFLHFFERSPKSDGPQGMDPQAAGQRDRHIRKLSYTALSGRSAVEFQDGGKN